MSEALKQPVERYGESLRSMRDLGRVALRRGVIDASGGEYQAARDDFYSVVYEGLSSDAELGVGFRVSKFDTYAVTDGSVMVKDGETRIVDIVENGYKNSLLASQFDIRMKTQADRDNNDLALAKTVDRMVRGELGCNTIFAVSACPRDAMARDGVRYWEKVGYVEDLNYVQMYRVDESGNLQTGSLSFFAGKSEIIQALQAIGVAIDDSVADEDVINHRLYENLSEDQAKQLAVGIRELCEAKSANRPENHLNTVDIVNRCSDEIDAVFEQAYGEIAKSLALGKKTSNSQQIIKSFLGNSGKYNQSVIAGLESAAESDVIDDESARLLRSLIVYSAIELIRARHLRQDPRPTSDGARAEDFRPMSGVFDMYAMLAHLAHLGAESGRRYGACGAVIEISTEDPLITGARQDVYGGRSHESANSSNEMKCVSCPECRKLHEKVRKVKGKYVCDNNKCKLSDRFEQMSAEPVPPKKPVTPKLVAKAEVKSPQLSLAA